LAELLPFEDSACFAITSVSTLRTMEAVHKVLTKSRFRGVELFGWRPFKGALFQQLQESMEAQILIGVAACACRSPCSTSAMPIALDSSGSYFVRFCTAVCRIQRECPSVGVVDAEEMRKDPSKFQEDASRPLKKSEVFGISCNPYNGMVYSSQASSVSHHALDDLSKQSMPPPTSWSANVRGWESREDGVQGAEPFPLGVGMLISKGTLEFIRQGRDGLFESTGVVWKNLPPKVLCCAFLHKFVGQAAVSVEEVNVNGLPQCIREQGIRRCTLSSWSALRS
jgi:hypothetical protein